MGEINLGYAIGLEPKDAIRYMESKGVKVSFRWQDVWEEEHAKAFTVAGLAQKDVLADVHALCKKAIATGQSEGDFKKELEAMLQSKGWWGKREIINPKTGESRVYNMTPARAGLIYRQNVQSAYMAGRYKQLMEGVKTSPYWQYVAIIDGNTRPSHARLHNKVWRYDDPIWQYLFPPNGWGCRCDVMPLTQYRMDKEKLKVESSEDKLVSKEVDVKTSEGSLKRTVWGYKDEKGYVTWTDAGFSYNPGREYVRDILGNAPLTPPAQAVQTWQSLGLPDLRDIPEGKRLPAPKLLPAAKTRAEALVLIEIALGFTESHSRFKTIKTPVGKRTISRYLLPHTVEKELDKREKYANFLLPTLQNPQEIWLAQGADGKLRENYIGLFQGAKNGILCVIRINTDGTLLYNFMQSEIQKLNKLRMGWLLFKDKKS